MKDVATMLKEISCCWREHMNIKGLAVLLVQRVVHQRQLLVRNGRKTQTRSLSSGAICTYSGPYIHRMYNISDVVIEEVRRRGRPVKQDSINIELLENSANEVSFDRIPNRATTFRGEINQRLGLRIRRTVSSSTLWSHV